MEDIKNELLWRLYAVFALAVIVGGFIFVRVLQIQIVEGAEWRKKADTQNVRYRTVKAERGNIMAEDGSLLATDVALFDVYFDAASPAMTDEDFKNNVDSLSFYLATYVNNSLTPGGWKMYLEDGRAKKARYMMLKKDVTYPERQFIQKLPLFKLGRSRGGLIIESVPKRQHPFQMLAHRTIGLFRENSQDIGLEQYYDKYLNGTQGQQLMQRVSGDLWIPINDITEISPQNGKDILTTLDINLQDITENALEKAVRARDADHGSAIVMDVHTGAIKAMANIGQTGKLAENGAAELWETYNFAVGESTSPGSTFKTATMMCLLEDGYIKLTDTIDLNFGKTKYFDTEMEDAEAHGLQKTTIQHAFELSSNVGVSQLAHKYYNVDDKSKRWFTDFLKRINMSQPTGLDLTGEPNPRLPEVGSKLWSGTSIPWMSIGYETSFTPLQILTFYNAIANNGRMMKPYLVKEIQEFGEPYIKFGPKATNGSICSSTTIEKLKTLLKGVVQSGTAKNIRSGNVPIAGKTGTAILNFNSNKAAVAKVYQASFAGFFPADNPQYSMIVVINHPRNNWYGATAAAPVVREVAEKVMSGNIESEAPINFGKKPDFRTATLPNGIAGFKEEIKRALMYMNINYQDKTGTNIFASTVAKNDSLSMLFRPILVKIVPNVVGMGLRDALFLMENAGVKVRFTGLGKVRSQSLKAGTKGVGQTVSLDLE